MRQVSIHRVPVVIIPHPTSFTPKKNSEQPCIPPPILFSAVRRKAGWILRCPLNGWIMSVLKSMPEKKNAVSFRWPLQSHTALLQLNLHEYLDCLTVVSHCTHQMQPPNTAIVRPLDTQYTWVLLSRQNLQHSLDNEWWKNVSHHWYAIPKGCNTKTVMNRLKKSEL